MKKQLGISIYLGKKPIKEDLNYITLAAKYGFSRIFTAFIGSSEMKKPESLDDFKKVALHAKNLNFEVFVDVNIAMLNLLGASHGNLKVLEDLGIAGIRLDEGFSGAEEASMSYTSNLKIEINASNSTSTLDNILQFGAKKSSIVACHNYYPRRYTGLSWENFLKSSQDIKKYDIRLAAFVSSNATDTFSNQDLMQGLPTLERHRDINIVAQAKDLFYCTLIDDVIIGNAYASAEEMQSLAQLDKEIITLDVVLHKDISSLYAEIITDNIHYNRGDASDYVIRSTMMRIKYKSYEMKPFNAVAINKGDITIDNELNMKYKGELHLARLSMDNSGAVNVVARVADYDLFLLEHIKPWSRFKFRIAN